MSNFQYGGALTEVLLAGVVAYRAGTPLEWNGRETGAADYPEAEPLIRPPARLGLFPEH